jgi:hypothetical protein
MKLYGSLVVAAVLAMVIVYQGNYFSYYNCMSATKLDYIFKKGAAHISAQCKVFVLDKIFVN